MKREQVLAALAYGFFLACTSVTLWGGYVRFLTGQVDPGSFMLEYFVRSATLPLSLAVSGLAAFYWPKARLWRSPILALGFFLAGSLLVALQHGGVVSSEWSLVVVGACFGWGSGIMFGALQEIVAAQKVFTAGIVVFAAAGISALLFFAVEVLPADAVPWMSLFVFVGAAVALTCAAWKWRSEGASHVTTRFPISGAIGAAKRFPSCGALCSASLSPRSLWVSCASVRLRGAGR